VSSKKKVATGLTPTGPAPNLPKMSPVQSQSVAKEAHIAMRDNAMFLLELASASESK